MFASAPLALTVFLFVWIFRTFDELFHPLLWPLVGDRAIPGLGILVGILVIFIIGLLAPSLLGRQILMVMERLVDRLPLAKLVYSGTKQIFDSFSHSSREKFSRVVMVKFPDQNSQAIGFVTSETKQSWMPQNFDSRTLSVFVPTTPNPTSGYLIFVRESDTQALSIGVDAALKLVISGGLVQPQEGSNQKPK